MNALVARFTHSLAFRIGALVILTEIFVSAVMGVIYVRNFNAEVDRRVMRNVLRPATLMNAGLLTLDVVGDERRMRELVGEELINAYVIGINGNIFYSLRKDQIGRRVDEVAGLENTRFDSGRREQVVRWDRNTKEIYSVAPLVGSDQRTVRFFVYIQASTTTTLAQKTANVRLFALGALGMVVLTCLVMLAAFSGWVFQPLRAILEALGRVRAGDLSVQIAGGASPDEMGKLARELNHMIAELRGVVTDLDHRVKERTTHLEAAMRELDGFAYSVSHDLRAPLRSINGFSRALEDDCGHLLDDQGKEHLRTIRAATQRMGSLIDGMLQLSRHARATLNRANVDLSSLARAISVQLQAQSPARQAEFLIEPNLNVNADASLIEATLQNLMENAWKFTARKDVTKIEFGSQLQDGVPAFFVRDNGCGFDMAYAQKLFRPFQRLHSQAEFAGTGIGLANVQRIIERHGGRVWIQGKVGEGATVFFTVPGLGTGRNAETLKH